MPPPASASNAAPKLRMARRNPWCDVMIAVAIEASPASSKSWGAFVIGLPPERTTNGKAGDRRIRNISEGER